MAARREPRWGPRRDERSRRARIDLEPLWLAPVTCPPGRLVPIGDVGGWVRGSRTGAVRRGHQRRTPVHVLTVDHHLVADRVTVRNRDVGGDVPLAGRYRLGDEIGLAVTAGVPVVADPADIGVGVDRVEVERGHVGLEVRSGPRPGVGRGRRMVGFGGVDPLGHPWFLRESTRPFPEPFTPARPTGFPP